MRRLSPAEWAVVLLLSLVALNAVVPQKALTQAPQVPAEQQAERATPDQQQAPRVAPTTQQAAPPISYVLSNTPQSEGQRQTTNGHQEADEFWTMLGLRAKATDFLLVIFTAGLFIATFFLWLATRKLVRGAENTAERQLRAYVLVSKCQIDWESGRIAHASVTIRNSGQTPAYQLHGWIGIGSIPTDRPGPGDGGESSQNDLGARGKMYWSKRTKPLTDTEWAGVRDRSIPFYIWGEIEYQDAFRHLRTTTYKLMLSKDDPTNWVPVPCGDGNKSD